MTPQKPSKVYGTSTELFVTRKVDGATFIIGGIGADEERWTRVLSQRAAQLLWYQLLQYLFPDKSTMVKSLATTAPMRDASMPTITTHMTVEDREDNEYTITGWAGENSWTASFHAVDAQRFWALLDKALYPVGWQG